LLTVVDSLSRVFLNASRAVEVVVVVVVVVVVEGSVALSASGLQGSSGG